MIRLETPIHVQVHMKVKDVFKILNYENIFYYLISLRTSQFVNTQVRDPHLLKPAVNKIFFSLILNHLLLSRRDSRMGFTITHKTRTSIKAPRIPVCHNI